MATYTFTATDVQPGGATQGALAGEAIAAGELVYLDPADGRARLARCDGTVDQAKVAGMAVNTAAAGQPVSYVAAGTVTVNELAFLGLGLLIVLSPTPGKAMDAADLVDTQYVTVIGWNVSPEQLRVDLAHTGIQRQS